MAARFGKPLKLWLNRLMDDETNFRAVVLKTNSQIYTVSRVVHHIRQKRFLVRHQGMHRASRYAKTCLLREHRSKAT
jgi:hypothetical protein